MRLLGLLCFLAAIILLVCAFEPFEHVRTLAVSSVPAAYRDRFTPALYHKIVLSLRVGSVLLALGAVALWIWTQPLARACSLAYSGVREVCVEIREGLRLVRADGFVHWVPLSIVFVFGVALRLRFYFEPVRYDEIYTYLHYASRPLFIGIAYYTANNHLLNTLLMHVSTALLGNAPWALRLPTLIAGILLIPLTYAVVRAFAGRHAALLSAALVSASSALIEYSFNARGYMLSAFWFMAGLGLIILIRRGIRGAWILLPCTAALMMYAVPTMLYAAAGMFLYLFIVRENISRLLAAGAATAVLTGMLYLPVLATVGPSAITRNQWVTPLARSAWPLALARELRGLGIEWSLDIPLWMSLLVAAGFVLALLYAKTRRQIGPAVFVSITAVALAFMFAQSVVPPRRTFLFLLPLYLGIASAGWCAVSSNWGRQQAAVAVTAVLVTLLMGETVLHRKSLENEKRIEAVGIRSAEPLVKALRPALLAGDQFICSHNEDAGLTYAMMRDHVPYHPLPGKDVLILVPFDETPANVLREAHIPPGEVRAVHRIAHFEDRDVYDAKRTPALPFTPQGNAWMGWFE